MNTMQTSHMRRLSRWLNDHRPDEGWCFEIGAWVVASAIITWILWLIFIH